ncbi:MULTISPECIES: SRPBCC family protein [Henriciella]|uniref:SRPBCC family protein n=1 Tax=Henriciella TaxID=453849 RepID=UPI00351402EF
MATPIDVTPANEFELVIGRIIDAPRHAVWRCWTEEDLLKQWHCPRPWSVPEADFDLRPGGRFNTVFAGPDGERMENKGMWLEIVPEERLVFTDFYTEGYVPQGDGFMTGFVELSDTEDGKTRFIWGARHRNAETMKRHVEMGFEQGWGAAADQLEETAQSVGARV